MSKRELPLNNPFNKNFGFTTQSKLRNHELKRPQTSAVNHSRDLYDPLTRCRKNQTNASKYTIDFPVIFKLICSNLFQIATLTSEQSSHIPRKCNKSQTISAFNHLGRINAPNFSKEYQKAYNKNGGAFKRSKGM